jgi:hypothetical protein
MKFKVILFKLFIQSSLDYSSTLFIYFSNQLDQNRLEKSFSRSIHRLLKVNLSEWDPRISSFVEMDIETQMKTLSVHNILPLKLRYFNHFIKFLHSNISKNSDSSLINYIMSHKKVEGTYRNNPLKMPVYSTNLAMFSFSSISIKIINLFLFKDLFLEKKQFTNFYNNNHNLFNAYSICLASSNSWL